MFFDIKCKKANLKQNAVVLVATIKALKYNGGIKKDELSTENLDALKIGIVNLEKHIQNLKKYNIPVIVALNKYTSDTKAEIEYVKNYCKNLGVDFSICEGWEKGGEGAIDLANIVLKNIDNKESNFKVLYEDNLSLIDKIKKVATEIYGADDVELSSLAKKEMKKIKELDKENLPICIAKTQYSFSDNKNLLGAPKNFKITINDIKLSNGAGFIVCIAGDIMTMPGLPKVPAAENIDIDENGEIIGLF